MSEKKKRKRPGIISNPSVPDLQAEAIMVGLLENDLTFTLTPEGRALFEDPEEQERSWDFPNEDHHQDTLYAASLDSSQ